MPWACLFLLFCVSETGPQLDRGAMSQPQDAISNAFLVFQRTGKPAALGQVFDAAAADLLQAATHLTRDMNTAEDLVQAATHLTRDMNTAEDLVQATFLVAISKADRYDPKRPVMRWLSGILANEAHRLRKQEGRPISAERLEHREVPEPSETLMDKELTQAVTDAINKLPAPYQPLLNLYLRYGFSVQELSVNLRRSPGTVRKQLSRGLAQLRKALPASLIAGAAVLTTPSVGLSAMREVVMAKASAMAAKAAGTSSALTLGKLGLWVGAGSLTAAALAVSLFAPDVGQVTLDELSPEAVAQVVAQKGSVDSPATASAELQADPFPSSSRSLMTFSFPVNHAPGGANQMKMNPISPSSLSRNLGVPSLLLGAMTLLPSLSQSQSVVYYYPGENAGDLMGDAVSGAGDVNLDGYADVIAGARNYDLDPDGTPLSGDETSNIGRAYVYSGKDGSTLYTFDGETAGSRFGSKVSSTSDANGDGFSDILVSAWGHSVGGRAYVFSGTDGSTLWTVDAENAGDELGWSISGAGDVNGDLFSDVVVGATGWDADQLGPDGTLNTADDVRGNGRAYVFSGKDGSTLLTKDGEVGGVFLCCGGLGFDSGDGFGYSVSGAGDVNFDGFSDIGVGARLHTADPDGTPATGDEISGSGRVYVYSGKDGSTLWGRYGENMFDGLGISMINTGDVDGDTYSDIAVGTIGHDADPDGTPGNGDEISNAGRVYVYSGKDGSTLHTFDGEGDSDFLGFFLGGLGVGDINGDGYSDIGACAPNWDANPLGPDGTAGTAGTGDESENNGRLYVYSGKDGTTLFQIDGGQAGEGLGTVSGAGDINGDGTLDIVAGAITYDVDPLGPDGTDGNADDVDSNGRIYVISGTPLSLTADKHLLSLSVANAQTMTIDAGVVNAGKNYWLFTGFAASGDTPGVVMAPGVVIPLNQPDPLTSFVIGLTQLGGGAPTFTAWKSTLDIAGKGTPSLNTFGPTPAPLGVTLHHAALVYTADGCGLGCDTFQLATNWVPMTTTP